MIREWVQQQWYRKNLTPWFWIFIPLSLIYGIITIVRRWILRQSAINVQSSKVPIIVVGNITVGGTGKTPLVIHIAKLLKQHSLRVGIVSRGYLGSKGNKEPHWVFANSDPNQVGDEPVLLAKRLFCPIVVASDRPKAVQALLDSGQVDVIISDDGLQHYALKRNIEIAVLDGKRRLGNGWVLPIGPLRESKSRLNSVDYIVVNSPITFDNDQEYDMELRPRMVYRGNEPGTQQPLSGFQGQTIHALAGIGFPDRFFELLKSHGLNIIEHPFPDHYRFTQKDIQFKDEFPILMTEKDAVKCGGFMDDRHWVLAVDAAVNPLFDMRLLTQMQELRRG